MSVFSYAKAYKAIVNGGTGKFSYSDVCEALINLPRAKSKLNRNDYDQIYNIYKEYKSYKSTFVVDMAGFIQMAQEIIDRIETITPYENVYGGNVNELRYVLGQTRKVEPDYNFRQRIEETQIDGYAKMICENGAFCSLTYDEALFFVKRVIKVYESRGKEAALQGAEELKNYLKDKNPEYWFPKMCFFQGAMNANEIISQEELDQMGEKLIIEANDGFDPSATSDKSNEITNDFEITPITHGKNDSILTDEQMQEVRKWKKLYDDGIINKEEFDSKRMEILRLN